MGSRRGRTAIEEIWHCPREFRRMVLISRTANSNFTKRVALEKQANEIRGEITVTLKKKKKVRELASNDDS